jgi:hypothetical protein
MCCVKRTEARPVVMDLETSPSATVLGYGPKTPFQCRGTLNRRVSRRNCGVRRYRLLVLDALQVAPLSIWLLPAGRAGRPAPKRSRARPPLLSPLPSCTHPTFRCVKHQGASTGLRRYVDGQRRAMHRPGPSKQMRLRPVLSRGGPTRHCAFEVGASCLRRLGSNARADNRASDAPSQTIPRPVFTDTARGANQPFALAVALWKKIISRTHVASQLQSGVIWCNQRPPYRHPPKGTAACCGKRGGRETPSVPCSEGRPSRSCVTAGQDSAARDILTHPVLYSPSAGLYITSILQQGDSAARATVR